MSYRKSKAVVKIGIKVKYHFFKKVTVAEILLAKYSEKASFCHFRLLFPPRLQLSEKNVI